MGVFKRYRDAQAAQKEAENAVPGEYQSNYTDRIGQTLDALGAGMNETVDVGTDSALYRQYRGNATQNARAAAENAAAGAAALSGGYGSSYANSVAQQGYQQEMANVDNGLSGLREKALSEYQLKKSGLAQLFSSLLNQDNLEAAEHQTAVSNAQNWRDYKQSRANQAAQEKNDFLSNLWQVAKSIGQAGLTAYDGYKGYTQQQWENEFAREQWEYNKDRAGQSDALNAYEQAFNLYQQGAGDAANAVLSRYGLDTGVFDNYSGAPITRADKANALSTAAGLAGNGSDTAARSILELYGLDPSAVDSYSTIANRQLSTAAASGSSGGSSRRSGSSSGSSGTPKKSSYTVSQLQSMAKEFRTMETSDPLYAHYKQVLTENGWIKADNMLETGNANKSSTGSLTWNKPESPQERLAKKYGTVTDTSKTSSTTKKSSSSLSRVQVAANAIKGQRSRGSNDQTIYNSLRYQGYTDDEILEAMNLAG